MNRPVTHLLCLLFAAALTPLVHLTSDWLGHTLPWWLCAIIALVLVYGGTLIIIGDLDGDT